MQRHVVTRSLTYRLKRPTRCLRPTSQTLTTDTRQDLKAVKQVGASGQISLGKEFAGRTVVVDSSEPGVWVIKTAQTIPDSELWLHQPEAAARLDRAMDAMDQPLFPQNSMPWSSTWGCCDSARPQQS